MRPEKKLRTIRIVSVVAATIIALACGTNYAYSAWGPQFADKLDLSSTQSNLISTSGNLGMYLFGIPLGKLVDSAGARVGALLGAVLLGAGYMGLYFSYIHGAGYLPLALLCFFAASTGAGGCVAFLGAMKTAAVNFPSHRGTATSFPLAAFGLSAFFFATVSGIISNDTDTFLLVVGVGTITMTTIPCLVLTTSPLPQSYSSLPTEAPRATRLNSGSTLKSKESNSSKKRESSLGPGTQYAAVDGIPSSSSSLRDQSLERRSSSRNKDPNDDGLESGDRHDDSQENHETQSPAHHSLYADVRGFAMLKYSECYELFLLIGLLTGIGLMTINNIGQDAQALWAHWDSKTDADRVRSLQRFHVSIISICSFLGRLLGGMGSDFIVKRLHGSRFWCLTASGCVFCVSQFTGLMLETPKLLFLLSGTNGLAYGILFGVSPTLVADTFGLGGFSQNWGFMTLGPAAFSELFNLIYGTIYDSHSVPNARGKLQCTEGRVCYRSAYIVTLVGSLAATVFTLWCIRHRHVKEAKLKHEEDEFDDDHIE